MYGAFRPLAHVDAAHPLFCKAYLYNVGFWAVTLQLAGIGIFFVATLLTFSAFAWRQGRIRVAQDESQSTNA